MLEMTIKTGREVRKMRMEREQSQSDLARRSGISRQRLNRIELRNAELAKRLTVEEYINLQEAING